MKPDCRRARKAAWKREKMRTDEEFRLNQQLSNHKWAKANPDYWRSYRREHPEKAGRNRQLQIIRNRKCARRRRGGQESGADVIAKVDASKSNKFTPLGRYYLVPMIAKVDAAKVRIYEISTPYP
jgi:hypothetical protein